MKMKKRLSVFTVTTIIGSTLILAGCGNGNENQNTAAGSSNQESAEQTEAAGTESKEPDVIRLAVMTGNITQEAAVIGEETGIYEKYGLQIEQTEFAAGINTVDALTLDQADIGMVADYAWVNRLGSTADSTTLKIFTRLGTTAGNGTKLYINKELASGVEDLDGKAIATITGTVWDYYNASLIEQYGLKDVEISNTSSAAEMEALYESGKVAALFASGQTATMVEALDFTETALTLEDLNVTTNMFYVADESYLKENEDVIERFLQANQEIYDYIADNNEEAAEIVYNKLAIPQETFLGSLKEADLVIDLKQDSIDALNVINTWAKAQGRYEQDYDAKDFVYGDSVKAVYPDRTDIQ